MPFPFVAVLTPDQDPSYFGNDVGVRIERQSDGTYNETYLAKDKKGKMRVILTSPSAKGLAFPRTARTSPALQSGADGLFDAPPSFSFTEAKVMPGRGGSEIQLTAKSEGSTIVKRIAVPSDGNLIKVEVQCDFAGRSPMIRYLLDSYAFAPDGKAMRSYGKPDATYAPAIRPSKGGVIGDHFFRSPVANVQKGELSASVMPDLDVLESNRYIPTILDLDAKNGVVDAPLISYGFADYRLVGHVYFVNDSSMTRLAPPQLLFAHEILLDAQSPAKAGYQRAAEHQWQRYGSKYIGKILPQAMPFAEYAKVCFPAALNEKETGGWFEANIDGQTCGGMPSGWGRAEGWVSWQPWFNQLRSAWGMHWWGKRLGNADWIEKSEQMLNLALAAPMDRGAVPTTYQAKQKTWKGSLISPDPKCYYDLTNMAWKGIWLLRWLEFDDCPRRDEILSQCRSMANLMLSKQNADGSFPTWLDRNLNVIPILDRSAQGALPTWFLAELGKFEAKQIEMDVAEFLERQSKGTLPDAKKANEELMARSRAQGEWAEKLSRAADFLADEVVDGQYWYDFETFFSCSPKQCFQRDGQFNHEKMRDPHTLQAPQNTLSMHWAAEALEKTKEFVSGLGVIVEAVGKTGSKPDQKLMSPAKLAKWHDASLRALDTLTLYQNVWPISYRKAAYTYGGFGVQNSDGEYNDARQAQFGDTLCDFGAKLGRRDYFERGVAAIRASLTLINHPLHVELGIYPNPNYPLGLQPENTGHGGTDQQNGRTGPDWGELSGLASMAWILDKYGSEYQVEGQKVIVDGGYVKPTTLTAEVNPKWDMSNWRMPGWTFEGNIVHWPMRNPRNFNWNNNNLPFIGTCEDGKGSYDDEFTGTVTSPAFIATGNTIRLNVGGGSGPGVYVELIDAKGKQLAVARGANSETMTEVAWDVSAHQNEPLRIRIVDSEKDGWGHINVGNIRVGS